ncbi:hypothetical protein [Aquisphaera insulae]|uniref:hypothetical protein n=1 Tax=Aquisphaera insulae TaxID=2712864 RepID=UPI0013EA5306|nr:hypothetical protein [Aquisphaera insulae]
MGTTKGQPAPSPIRSDARFPYLAQLPPNVPPIEAPYNQEYPSQVIGPPTITYYFPIALDGCNPTGVFFPKDFAFVPGGDVDVILYFHGWKDGEFANVKTINYYWSGRFHDIKLREDVNNSGKSVILILPMLGDKPGSLRTADMGVFKVPGGGDDFLAEARKWIGRHVPQYKGTAPNVRNVVLAGHSGGGVILDIQARSMKANICEVWCFDSIYGQWDSFQRDVVKDWLDVADRRASTRFFFSSTSETSGNAVELKGKVKKADAGRFSIEVFSGASASLPRTIKQGSRWNDFMIPSGSSWHYETITRNFQSLVKNAKCLT